MSKRPYLGRIKQGTYVDKETGVETFGLFVSAPYTGHAHLTKAEAFEFSNLLTDAAEKLPDPEVAPTAEATVEAVGA